MRSEGTVIGFVCLFVLANNSLVVSLFILQMTQLTNKGVKFCGIFSALLQSQSPSSIVRLLHVRESAIFSSVCTEGSALQCIHLIY